MYADGLNTSSSPFYFQTSIKVTHFLWIIMYYLLIAKTQHPAPQWYQAWGGALSHRYTLLCLSKVVFGCRLCRAKIDRMNGWLLRRVN